MNGHRMSGTAESVSSLQPPALRKDDNNHDDEEVVYRTKAWEIQDCLRGYADNDNDKHPVMDVWKLRELALSPGGLLEPNYRKRAWPVLTGVTESLCFLGGSSQQSKDPSMTTTTTTPFVADLQALHRDVRHTVWNVQEHFTQQLKLKQQQQQQQQAVPLQQQQHRRRVSFSPVLSVENRPPSSSSSMMNHTNHSYPSSSYKENNDKEEDEKKIEHNNNDPFDQQRQQYEYEDEEEDHSWTSRTTNHTEENSIWSQSVMSCRRVRWRTASAAEQKIVANVITAVLRSSNHTTAPHPCFQDDRLRYYTGFHDLTALCMVNLESPSLSSLVLTQLAKYHLRDAMRQEKIILECALQYIFFPVLKQVDPELHHAITETAQITNPSVFARGWVASWFASDLPDVAVASRLLDAFLVSHPTMPIYTAVAFVTHHRHRILHQIQIQQQQQQQESNKNKNNSNSLQAAVLNILRNLPVYLQEDDDDEDVPYEDDNDDDDASSMIDSTHVPINRAIAMTQIEKIIASTLSYMDQVPPDTLIPNHTNNDDEQDENNPWRSLVPAVVMLQPASHIAPAYYKAHTSWNEYTWLQMAKRMRDGKTVNTAVPPSPLQQHKGALDWKLYPLARIATGQKKPVVHLGWDNPEVQSRFRVFIIAVIVLFLLAEPRDTTDWKNATIHPNNNDNSITWFQKSTNKPPIPSRKNRLPSKLTTASGSMQTNQKRPHREKNQKKPVAKETLPSFGNLGSSTLSSLPSVILSTVPDAAERVVSSREPQGDYPQTVTIPSQTPKSPSAGNARKNDGTFKIWNLVAKMSVLVFRRILDTTAGVPNSAFLAMQRLTRGGKHISINAGKCLTDSIQSATPNLFIMNALHTPYARVSEGQSSVRDIVPRNEASSVFLIAQMI